MKKFEEPHTVIDGADAFPHFEDPEWLKKMLAASREYFAQPAKPNVSRQAAESKWEEERHRADTRSASNHCTADAARS